MWNLIIPAAAALIGGRQSAKAAGRAADVTASAADRAADLQREQFERQVQLQEPYRQAGVNALAKMGTGFTGEVNLMEDPGYAFRLEQGQKALERSAAMRGGLISGNTGGALQRFGQGLASQEYQNAYDRALGRYNTTAALAGIGQTATNQMGTAGGNYANAVGNIGMGQADVGANALLAAQQARSSSYGQVGNVLGRYLGGGGQAAFSQTGLGGSGFGSGLAYGNQDLGQYL
jgi:hypothetical protein